MAGTFVWKNKTVWGNKRVQYGLLTANGTDATPTGLKWVESAFLTPSTAAGGSSVEINTAASAAGDIKLSTGVTGGVYHILVIGN